MHAEETELTETKAEAEGGKYPRSQHENKSLEESRHSHHRDGLKRGPRELVFARGVIEGTDRSSYRRNHTVRVIRRSCEIATGKRGSGGILVAEDGIEPSTL